MADKNYKSFVGRRKEAVARLRLYVTGLPTVMDMDVKKGDIIINGKKAETYFSGMVAKATLEEPLKITNTLGKYTLVVKVEGGGTKSQLEAFIHAISKALSSLDEKNKHILKKKGFLTRDARVRERRKVGMGGKSRRKRQSPKR
ncbi:MAG: 30S ribosomal protein S9 [Candidatus Levyibacteriota bacterium]|jgi:small subunit ribosomal protein S9